MLLRIGDLALQGLDSQVFLDKTLGLATDALKNDGGVLLLRDELGRFTSAQSGAPAVVSELLGLLQQAFDRLVATGGRECVALTRPGHRLDVAAASIPGVDRCMGVICLARLAADGGFLPDERDMLLSFAQTTSVALQKLVLRENLERHLVDTITAFVNAIESKDPYLKGHSARVALYATEVATVMGVDGETIQIVSRGAMLHDLGKLSIMDTILRKPDRLTTEEFALIKAHPEVGERILKPLRFLHRESCAVRSHHERFDGTGYPDGLKGEDIPLVARIVTVADVFDAVTSNRPYRKALLVEPAREEIARGRGTHFDPQVADAFASIQLERLVEITRHYESLVSAPLGTTGELARAS
jgi:HD-GYP domain-containing protein (c-di-GMP phosphodiesterase class II)